MAHLIARRFVLLLPLLLFCLLPAVPAKASAPAASMAFSKAERTWLDAHPVVRVGFATELPPYYFYTDTGRYEGFVVELLDRIARVSGMRFEFRRFDTQAEVMQALGRREIDMTPFAAESEARRKLARFTRAMFATNLVIAARRELGDVSGAADFGAYRVAVEQDSPAEEVLRTRFPTAAYTRHASAEQAILAVASGSADIFVGFRQIAAYHMEKHLLANVVLRGSLTTATTALGPAVRLDAPELAEILDKAVGALGPGELTRLAAQWLPRSAADGLRAAEVALTAGEREWLAVNRSIRVGYDASFAPITFVNEAGGFDGLAAQVARLASDKVGLVIAAEEGGSFASIYERALKGEIDVVVGAARNAERRRDFDFVGPFLQVPSAIVTSVTQTAIDELADLEQGKVALLRSHFLIPMLRARHPRMQLVEFDTQQQVLDAVARGAAGAAIGNVKVVNRLIDQRYTGALAVRGVVEGGDSELYFAVRNTRPELAMVLRKGLDAITPQEFAELQTRWMTVEVVQGVPWQRLLAIGLPVAIAVMLAIGVLMTVNRRLHRARAAEAEARSVAESAAQSRAGFIAYLSHELRGSIGTIGEAAELLRAGPPGQDTTQRNSLLGAMRDSAHSLMELFERSLDFERMAQQGADLHLQPQVLRAVLDEAVAPLALQAQVKGLRFESDIAIAPELVAEVDRVRLSQVLHNLGGNAVKFTAQGSVRMRAWREGERLRIEISDTGAGMTPQEQQRLFVAYAQGEAGRRAGRGAGLGLAIVQRIVKAMDGSIEVHSAVGEGTRWSLSLPLAWQPVEVSRAA